MWQARNILSKQKLPAASPFLFAGLKMAGYCPSPNNKTYILPIWKFQTPVATPAGEQRCRCYQCPHARSRGRTQTGTRLQASIPPPARAFKTLSIEVRAQTDIGALLGATLEASIDESTPLSLLDDGTSPDQVAGDGYACLCHRTRCSLLCPFRICQCHGTEPARIVRTFETIHHPTIPLPVLSFWIIKNTLPRRTTPLPPPSKTNPYSSMS